MRITSHLVQICILMSLILNFNSASSQTSSFQLSLEGGPNYFSQWGSSEAEEISDSKFNYGLGISGQYNFNDVFSVKTGMSYERKKIELHYVSPIENNFDGEANYEYLNIPLLFKATVQKMKSGEFFINAGPYMGILLNQRLTGESFREGTIDRDNVIIEKNEYGISIGAGYLFYAGNHFGISVEVRNNRAMSYNYTFPYFTSKSNTANLLVGVSFLGSKRY